MELITARQQTIDVLFLYRSDERYGNHVVNALNPRKARRV